MVSYKLQLLISYKPAEVRQPTKSRSDEIRTLKKNWREKMLETISVFRENPSSIGGNTLNLPKVDLTI